VHGHPLLLAQTLMPNYTVVHLGNPHLRWRWRPSILEFHVGFPITGTVCTRLAGCTGIAGLCRTCF